jgi:hypothetical protein
VLVALATLGAASIVLSGWSLTSAGVGWDTRGDTLKAGIARSLPADTSLDDAYDAVPSDNEFYGLLVHQLADVLRFAVTAEWPTPRPDDATTYRFQAIATLLLAVVGVTALAAAVAFAFRSPLAGLATWALTLSTPLWLGMSHVDFKDIPVAAGLSLVSAGLVATTARRRHPAMLPLGVVSAAAGGAIAVGTRAGAIALVIALTGLTTLATGLVTVCSKRGEGSVVRDAVVTSGAAVVGALGFVRTTNPLAHIDLPRWLADSVDSASRFPWTGTIRTAGRDVSATDLPWGYLPAWFAAQLPLLTSACMVASALVFARAALRRSPAVPLPLLPLVPLVVQAFVIPAVMVLRDVVLYDATRHVLFVLPALFALTAVGLGHAEIALGASGRRGAALAIGLAAVVVVSASFAASLRWAPYAYAFVNPAAARIGDGRGWELDFWGVTGREGFERLRALGIADVAVAPADRAAWAWYEPPGREAEGAGEYVFLRGSAAPNPACTEVFRITRDGNTLGIGSRCPPGSVQAPVPPPAP